MLVRHGPHDNQEGSLRLDRHEEPCLLRHHHRFSVFVDDLVDAADHDRAGVGPLTRVLEPRKPGDVRRQFSTVLALAVYAVMAGRRSFTAIGE
jgi:hypothetical protein